MDEQYFEVVQNLVLIEAAIDNDICKGNVGLLFAKDEADTYIPVNDYDTFRTYKFSKIELSQKGSLLTTLIV